MALAGVSPRQWPAHLVGKVITVDAERDEDPSDAYIGYLHSWWLWRLVQAAHYLDRALAAIDRADDDDRQKYWWEAAYFAARHCGDAPTARAYLAQAGQDAGEAAAHSTRWRAETAVRLAETDPDKAWRDALVRFRWASRQQARQDSSEECRM
jgi:hypothetical protein